MAPPFKRRKLSGAIAPEDMPQQDNDTPRSEVLPSYPHVVESEHTLSSLAPAENPVHLAIMGSIEYIKVLVPRQATTSTTSPTLPTSPSPTLPDATTLSSPTISFPSISSPTLPADTIPAGVSATSSSTTTTSSSTVLDSSSTATTTSGLSTPSANNSGSTFLTSSATLSSLATGFSATATNATNTTTASATGRLGSNSLYRGNDSRTFMPSDSGVIYLATLLDGDVTTISRHRDAFTTTLSDGERFTIPAISASSTRTSMSSFLLTSPTNSATTSGGVAGGDVGGTSVAPVAPTNTGAVTNDGNSNTNDSTPPAGTIAGGVVGGAAGLAVLLLIAMLFLRWYRRKSVGQHRALPPGSMDSPEPNAFSGSRGPGMAERAGLMPFLTAVPGLFRHQHASLAGSSEPSERGFTRVSGRKLPSAFSEGMSSEGIGSQHQQPAMPMTGAGAEIRSESSSYRDSYGRGGAHSPVSPSSLSQRSSGPMRNSVQEMMTMSVGPQRQPQVHSGGPYNLASSGNAVVGFMPAGTATVPRSDTPASLRNSRFTEDMA